MERRGIIILTVLGAIAGIYGAITYQWMLMIIALAVIVLILIGSDVARVIASPSPQDRSADDESKAGMKNLEKSVESIRYDIRNIEQRLSELENSQDSGNS
jgi:cytochrome c biogenesis protein CcdA